MAMTFSCNKLYVFYLIWLYLSISMSLFLSSLVFSFIISLYLLESLLEICWLTDIMPHNSEISFFILGIFCNKYLNILKSLFVFWNTIFQLDFLVQLTALHLENIVQ